MKFLTLAILMIFTASAYASQGQQADETYLKLKNLYDNPGKSIDSFSAIMAVGDSIKVIAECFDKKGVRTVERMTIILREELECIYSSLFNEELQAICTDDKVVVPTGLTKIVEVRIVEEKGKPHIIFNKQTIGDGGTHTYAYCHTPFPEA